MEEQIFYKKVYIHSEDDLPKETGRYWCHEKYVKSQDLIDSYHYDKDDKDFCCDWLNTFDWYLLPVPLPSDEEIEEMLWEEINIPLSQKDKEFNTDAYKQYQETLYWMRWMRDNITAK